MRHCDNNHRCVSPLPAGQAAATVPTRLIFVGSPSQPGLRLVHPPRCGAGPPPRYVALSHCWGSDVPESQRFCTYRTNIDEHKRGIRFDRLPSSFRDAVTLTRSLGVEYLWIDSVCIIQRDEDDWEAESGRMEDVFSSAYCTVAASSAPSSLAGFLGRRGREPRPCCTVGGDGHRGGPFYLCKSIDDFERDVESSILNSRGWVLQERALSRRIIHMAENQIYLECYQGIHSETLARIQQ